MNQMNPNEPHDHTRLTFSYTQPKQPWPDQSRSTRRRLRTRQHSTMQRLLTDCPAGSNFSSIIKHHQPSSNINPSKKLNSQLNFSFNLKFPASKCSTQSKMYIVTVTQSQSQSQLGTIRHNQAQLDTIGHNQTQLDTMRHTQLQAYNRR